MANSEKQDGPSSVFNRKAIEFGLDIYAALAKDDEHRTMNTLIAPLAIHFGLGILYMGAAGRTAKEFQKCLRLSGTKQQVAKKFWRVICKYMDNRNTCVKSAVFMRDDITVDPKTDLLIKKYFKTEVQPIDCKSPTFMAGKINKWACQGTNQQISEVIHQDHMNTDCSMLLTCVTIIQRSWKKPFSPTGNYTFWLNNTNTREVPMMIANDIDLRYYESTELDCIVLDIPFDDGDLSMLILYPNAITGIDLVEYQLQELDLIKLRRNTMDYKTSVLMPKFRLEGDMLLNEILNDCGIHAAFSENQADFSQFSNSPLFATEILFRAIVDVREGGLCTTREEGDKYHFDSDLIKVDHPFLFAIMSKKHRLFLFGAVRDPAIKTTLSTMSSPALNVNNEDINELKETSNEIDENRDAAGDNSSSHIPDKPQQNDTMLKSEGYDQDLLD
ncbi:unnamed protein product [Hermetia illucens]|uniref:Serpin domain-containing protein n=1 Tax=Hermetia illucens TaxID=343691 RepID=A0A7R8UK55_HERIL|nr:serine protease inhibitor 42Dd-like [Hermetia illucens]CAD7082129.1 unnamed protein product [Hermetia illucens]